MTCDAGVGLADNKSECQSRGCESQGTLPPWADHKRADAKDKLFKYALENPTGIRPAVAAREVISPDAIAGEKDGRLARRFFENHSNLFKIDKRGRNLWVEPRTAAFHLTTNKQEPKPTEGDGTEIDTARRILSKRSILSSKAERGALLQQLAAKRQAIDDRYNVFQNRLNPDQHLVIPYRTRFNSTERVSEARDRYRTAWDEASKHFDNAIILSLTTDSKRFDSLLDASESLMADIGRFKSWLSNRCDETPKNIVVPEFTDSGLPHIHIVLFDIGFLPHAMVSNYWDTHRDRGEIVWIDSIHSRDGSWVWANGRPRKRQSNSRQPAGSSGPRKYLGKVLADAMSLSKSDASDVQAAASALRGTDGTVAEESLKDAVNDAQVDAERWWKLALYFATNMRFFTCSPFLNPSDRDDTLPYVAQWEYVGTARFGDLPGHIQQNATVLHQRGQPPPPSAVVQVDDANT